MLEMNIRQLMQLDVDITSASKRPQKLHDAASAIYVVTQEDIRRSGVTNVPEALRMVPGVYVAKKNQNDYVVTIRGMENKNEGASSGVNKLLVLVDGRSIYSPVYGGVLWQAQDFMMEDIDRIEVIRGPGGALWGSNAVAGVINIITKSASETQGALMSAMGGTNENGGAARWGGKVGEKFDFRVYGKYRDQGPGRNSNNDNSHDGRQFYQSGFRGELKASDNDLFTLQGDGQQADVQTAYQSEFVSYSPPFNASVQKVVPYQGDNVLGRWDRKLDSGGSLKFQAYFDQARWEVFNSNTFALNTVDLEFQHNFEFWERNKAAWGLNYRNMDFETPRSINNYISNQNLNLASFFVHDEIALLPNTWSLILGSKFEHNDYTGMEYQPNVRTVWTPHPNHTFWAAVSRAVRIPEMVTRTSSFNVAGLSLGPALPPYIFQSVGNGTARAETLLAYEAGYRINAIPKKLSFDATLFVNDYDRLTAATSLGTPVALATSPTGTPILLQQALWANDFAAKLYGGELSGEWQVFEAWRLTGSYSYKYTDFIPAPSRVSSTFPASYDKSPQFMVRGRSYLQLPYNLEFDTTLAYQDQYQYFNIPGYAQLNQRLGWKPVKQLEISIVGQNLIRDRHPEMRSDLVPPGVTASEIPRAFLGKVTWQF